jgi:hypothetical protein
MYSTTEPKIDTRGDQHYAGIRLKTPPQDFDKVIPVNINAVYDWLGQHGIASTGAPFMRYNVINMADQMDVEIGVPVASPIVGDNKVKPGVLPAGRYASLVYRDVTRGEDGNGVLIDWAKTQGLKWDHWQVPEGDAFGSRYEIFLSGPQDDPDPTMWDTEVAIKLAE